MTHQGFESFVRELVGDDLAAFTHVATITAADRDAASFPKRRLDRLRFVGRVEREGPSKPASHCPRVGQRNDQLCLCLCEVVKFVRYTCGFVENKESVRPVLTGESLAGVRIRDRNVVLLMVRDAGSTEFPGPRKLHLSSPSCDFCKNDFHGVLKTLAGENDFGL